MHGVAREGRLEGRRPHGTRHERREEAGAQQHAQRGDAMRRHHEQGLLDPAEFWAGHAFRGPAMVAVAAVPGDA